MSRICVIAKERKKKKKEKLFLFRVRIVSGNAEKIYARMKIHGADVINRALSSTKSDALLRMRQNYSQIKQKNYADFLEDEERDNLSHRE